MTVCALKLCVIFVVISLFSDLFFFVSPNGVTESWVLSPTHWLLSSLYKALNSHSSRCHSRAQMFKIHTYVIGNAMLKMYCSCLMSEISSPLVLYYFRRVLDFTCSTDLWFPSARLGWQSWGTALGVVVQLLVSYTLVSWGISVSGPACVRCLELNHLLSPFQTKLFLNSTLLSICCLFSGGQWLAL